jgi:PTS system mannose-specific IIA component
MHMNHTTMTGLLILAHAPLASSLKAVAAHVYPSCDGHLAAMDVEPGASLEQVEALAREKLAALGQPEVLILADVFGATPCNAALKLADGVHVRVVAGVNVPMLWRALCYAEEPLDALVVRAVDGATQGVMQLAVPRRQNQGPGPLNRDQVDHSHQQ